MKTRDYRNAFIIGAAASALWFFVLSRLALFSETELLAGAILLPFAFAGGMVLARRIRIFHKGAKFVVVGVLNTGIDFFIFNTLIAATGAERGFAIPLFKSASFFVAMVNSYELNRLWTFGEESEPSRSKKEFAVFAAVTIVGFFINIGVTSLIANAKPLFAMTQIRWDNAAAAAATALNLFWNFFGYKLFVFKSKKRVLKIIPPPV